MKTLRLIKKKKINSYVLVIVSNYSNKVLEKIGTYNNKNKNLSLNIFRLIYWVSKNIFLTGNVFNLFLKICLIKNNNEKK